MDNINIICDSHHGIYLPSVWVKNTYNIWGIDDDTWEYIGNSDNLEDDYYWDEWHNVLNNAECIIKGKHYTLHQDGDLFAIAYDDMTDDERIEFFGE